MNKRLFATMAVLLLGSVVLLPPTHAQNTGKKSTERSGTRGMNKRDQSKEVKGMIVSAIQFTFAAKDADKAEALLREIRDASVKEPGVVRFEVARGTDDPNVFVLWEVYRDQGAVDEHKATDHYKEFVLNGIRPLAQQRTAVTASPIDE